MQVSCKGANFNPRSPAGSDPELFKRDGGLKAISIHAPLRGATDILFHVYTPLYNFNPRSPAGSDEQAIAYFEDAIRISIHAPLRGATACL